MAVLVLICGEKYEYLLVQSRQVHLKEELGQAFFLFLFLFLHLFFQPCPCMSTTLIFFMFFPPSKSPESRGYPKDRRSESFLDPRRIFPGNGFHGVMYISFSSIPMII